MQRSDGGGVFDIQDRINGLNLCGCKTITSCQVYVEPETSNSDSR